MNNSKHTPGPWAAHCGDTVAFVNSTAPSVAKDGGEATITALIGGQHGATLEELHANARLIAAAPTMYEALQAVVAELATFGHINSQDNDPDGTESPSIAKVFAAIKAATI